MFGVSCAPELFQKVMESIVAGLDGVIVYLDDAVVFGTTVEEHDRRLAALLKRFAEYNILLNEEKCVYSTECLEFLGHQLSVQGVKPTESRILAIQNFREPQNLSELRSFLGLVCYVGRFVPNLASLTDPLRQLLRSKGSFEWTCKQTSAFQRIKEEICQIQHLGFFNPKDQTKLMTDASPTGLGAVLLQVDSEGNCRVIAYASKALTELEKKYFQTEREALSLVWGVEKFRLYLLGIQFTLITDCKALKFLFSPRSRPCARIERWVLRLQGYTFRVEHVPGSDNIADALSRLSVPASKTFDEPIEGHIWNIVSESLPMAVTVEKVTEDSKKDETIQKVIEALQEGTREAIPREFKPYMDELCSVDGVLLRANRLVIPTQLQERVIALAHEAHPGMAAMKRRLRQKVWWPQMDKQVEFFVKRCKECTLVSCLGAPEPLKRTKMPEKPWKDIAVDFMGPLPSGHSLFVIVDYFSRFTEAIVMKTITARRTIQALHETFSRFGVPESIRSDNGPQFISEEFKSYCKEYGITLLKTTPYWPQANGEVERANKTILKHLKISQETGSDDWMWDLRSFLLMYNSTPHASTGVAPSTLMFGRVLRDKLPAFGDVTLRMDQEAICDRDWERKLKDARYADERRQAKPSNLKEGDVVVCKRMIKENKLSTTFAPEEFEVIELKGSDATLRSFTSGREVHRNVAHLKRLLKDKPMEEPAAEESAPVQENENWPHREDVEGGKTVTTRPVREHRRPTYLNEYQTNAVHDF